jgi:hypothetical protein
VTGVFARYQPQYAERGIATFPCTSDKTPAVRNYGRFGVQGSSVLTARFPEADALGFMCGSRSRITVLDIDSKDERILADAITRHGKTPIVIRTGSGHFQVWYRNGGERRRIRPNRGVPIDILGGGYVVAPPSHVVTGNYQFIQGTLDDLANLPGMLNPIAATDGLSADWANKREGDGRNNALFSLVGRAAHKVDDFEQLLDCARTRNSDFHEPLDDAEVMKVATSVWKMQCEGRNRFGQIGAYIPQATVKELAKVNPDALALYSVLKAHHGPNKTFAIANAMANNVVAMGWRRFVNARKALIDGELVRQVRAQTRQSPALYCWPNNIKDLTGLGIQSYQSGE